jgi:hypothetical protein
MMKRATIRHNHKNRINQLVKHVLQLLQKDMNPIIAKKRTNMRNIQKLRIVSDFII